MLNGSVLLSTVLFGRHNDANPDGYVVKHKNNNKFDNRLKNLQLITQQQKCKKNIMLSFITSVLKGVNLKQHIILQKN